MKRTRDYDTHIVHGDDAHSIIHESGVSFLTPIRIDSMKKRTKHKTHINITDEKSLLTKHKDGMSELAPIKIQKKIIVPNTKLPDADVPIVTKMTYDSCWVCYRAKPRGLRQVCSSCVLKLHKHTIKKHVRRHRNRTVPFVYFSCNQCKIVVKHKTNMPSTCTHSLQNTCAELWSCSCCDATYTSIGKAGAHFINCYKSKDVKHQTRKIVIIDTNNVEKLCIACLNAQESGNIDQHGWSVVTKYHIDELGLCDVSKIDLIREISKIIYMWKTMIKNDGFAYSFVRETKQSVSISLKHMVIFETLKKVIASL